jgi:hypothetical protein
MSKEENIFLGDTPSELNKSCLHMHTLQNLDEFHSNPYLIILESDGGTVREIPHNGVTQMAKALQGNDSVNTL